MHIINIQESGTCNFEMTEERLRSNFSSVEPDHSDMPVLNERTQFIIPQTMYNLSQVI